jgi:hypothetical protein
MAKAATGYRPVCLPLRFDSRIYSPHSVLLMAYACSLIPLIVFPGPFVRIKVFPGARHRKMIWGDWRSHPMKGGKMALLPLTALMLSSVDAPVGFREF